MVRLGAPSASAGGAASTQEWQADDELAPLTGAVALGRDPAAVHFDQAAHQGQANAQPALRAVDASLAPG